MPESRCDGAGVSPSGDARRLRPVPGPVPGVWTRVGSQAAPPAMPFRQVIASPKGASSNAAADSDRNRVPPLNVLGNRGQRPGNLGRLWEVAGGPGSRGTNGGLSMKASGRDRRLNDLWLLLVMVLAVGCAVAISLTT